MKIYKLIKLRLCAIIDFIKFFEYHVSEYESRIIEERDWHTMFE